MRKLGAATQKYRSTTVNAVSSQISEMARFALMISGLIVFAALAIAAPVSKANAEDLSSTFGSASQGSEKVVDHNTWTSLLQKYVVAGKDGLNRVNYGAFKADGHDALKRYVTNLQRIDPRTLSRNEQFAYWANLYNAKTIDVVLDHYPISSIRKISIDDSLFGSLASSVGAGGPWKTKIMRVAGFELSLDDIEHGILRPVFKDPRVHYAVNCASIGCPNLATQAFTGANLETLLDTNARAFINSPRGISVKDGQVTASSIYKWFRSDFGGSNSGVLKHALVYAAPELKEKLSNAKNIDSFRYDWALNDVK